MIPTKELNARIIGLANMLDNMDDLQQNDEITILLKTIKKNANFDELNIKALSDLIVKSSNRYMNYQIIKHIGNSLPDDIYLLHEQKTLSIDSPKMHYAMASFSRGNVLEHLSKTSIKPDDYEKLLKTSQYVTNSEYAKLAEQDLPPLNQTKIIHYTIKLHEYVLDAERIANSKERKMNSNTQPTTQQ